MRSAEPLALLEARPTLGLLHTKLQERLVEVLWQRAPVASCGIYSGDEYNICDAWASQDFLLAVLL